MFHTVPHCRQCGAPTRTPYDVLAHFRDSSLETSNSFAIVMCMSVFFGAVCCVMCVPTTLFACLMPCLVFFYTDANWLYRFHNLIVLVQYAHSHKCINVWVFVSAMRCRNIGACSQHSGLQLWHISNGVVSHLTINIKNHTCYNGVNTRHQLCII